MAATVGDIEALVIAGRAAWPGIEVVPAAFAAYLAERAGEAGGFEAPLTDLYLACACAAGDQRAMSAFERAYFVDVDAAAGPCAPRPAPPTR